MTNTEGIRTYHSDQLGQVTIPEDVDYDLADKIEAVLEAASAEGMTPSAVARKVKADYIEVRNTLWWMDREQYIHTTGNGAWTRYHAGRR